MWLALQREVNAATYGHAVYDLRKLLTLQTAAEQAVWLESRRHWLATTVFKNDPRVRL